MIQFHKINKEKPFNIFKEKYNKAIKLGQSNVEAVVISTYDEVNDEVDSRFVNLKCIERDKFIFFSNYNSPKSVAFLSHNQIGALFYWSATNTQIRIKAKITRTSHSYNKKYFKERAHSKNALAISSNQSEIISSYDEVIKRYELAKEKKDLSICPEYWGGFSFTPYYFEFWEGHKSRINKRIAFNKTDKNNWHESVLQP